MPRKKRTAPYKHAEDILRRYWTNKKLLDERTRDYALDSPKNTWTRGIKNDPTAVSAIRLADDQYVAQLKNYTRAVEETLFEFAGRENGAAVIMLVKLIYWDRTNDLNAAAEAVHLSPLNAQRACDGLICELTRRLGWGAVNYRNLNGKRQNVQR